jgi:hypothetical protein
MLAPEGRRLVDGGGCRDEFVPPDVAPLGSSSLPWPVRLRTITFSTLGVPSSARSTLALSSMILPRRQPPSAVMMTLALQSLTRSLMASLEKPPKITVWTTPRRAQASIAIAASGTMGM